MTVRWPDDRLLARQRRSTIDWYSLVPRSIAAQQIDFERCATAIAMRKAGMTYRAAAALFGVSASRIQQMEGRHAYKKWRKAPVERYFDEVPEVALPISPVRPLIPPQHNAHFRQFLKLIAPVGPGCSSEIQMLAARERDLANGWGPIFR
jgi:hypothetical protein